MFSSANGVERWSIAQFIAHLRTPLYRNGYALVVSSATTSVLGVAYWILAAHYYSTEAVGLNSAAISAMMFLSGIAQLNLISALVRFIPVAGRATRQFIVFAYLVTLFVSLGIGILFLRGLDRWAPALSFLDATPLFVLWFIAATMAWGIFALQDSVLTGLRQATWVPIENTLYALVKLALLVGLATLLPRYGVFASWTIALAVSLLPTNFLIFRRLVPNHARALAEPVPPLVPAQIVKYIAGDYVGSLFWLACTTLLPVMVTQLAGATANAYFFLAWQIAYSLHLVGPNMGSSLIAEAANDQTKLSVYSYRVFIATARVVVPIAIIVALGAPYILRIFGPSYASEGTTLLRLLSLSAIPNIVQALYVSIARVQRRIAAIVTVLGALCTLVLILSYVLLRLYGIVGVGVAWLVSQTIVAVVLVLTEFRAVWASRRADGRREVQ